MTRYFINALSVMMAVAILCSMMIFSVAAVKNPYSLLPAASDWTVESDGDAIMVVEEQADGTHFTAQGDGRPSAWYTITDIEAMLCVNVNDPDAMLHWDFEVLSGTATVVIYFVGQHPTDRPINEVIHSLNYYIDPENGDALDADAKDLPVGRYQGSIAASDLGVSEVFQNDAGDVLVSGIKVISQNGEVVLGDVWTANGDTPTTTTTKIASTPTYRYTELSDGSLEITGRSDAFPGWIKKEPLDFPATIDGKSVTVIGGFTNRFYPTYITIPEGVTTIREDAFYVSCEWLTDVVLPASLTTIGDRAFLGNHSNIYMSYMIVPPSVTSIGEKAIGYHITSINTGLPDAVGGFESTEEEPIDGFVVYGKNGTVAQQYAEENGLTFVNMDSLIDGDVNNDRTLNMKDAFELYNVISGNMRISSMAKWQGDITGDTALNATDAFVLYNLCAGH